MMRHSLCAIALLAAAIPAAAQMPSSITKPIDLAKRQANKTSAQINNEQKAGNDQGAQSAAMPGASAQSAGQKRAPVTKAAPPAQKGAPPSKAAPNPAAADSTQPRGSVSQNGTKGTVTFYRETFSYDGEGRRDPFLSLMATGELRPMLADLTLVGIIYDESGRNSVAILVDASTGGQTYRKKVGDTLGRIKVTRIAENDITLNVDEFGFARQETLLIDRNPRTGARRPQ
jgi:hypothetical protein